MTELDLTDGKIFLNKVTEKIRTRLAEVDASIEAGQKDIQSMNEYYWENYTEMDEYGYENYDNQQALLHQVNDNPVSYTHLNFLLFFRTFVLWTVYR